jgi:hypothetical protein
MFGQLPHGQETKSTRWLGQDLATGEVVDDGGDAQGFLGTCGRVVSNWKATTDHLVAALWPNGHRGDSGELPRDGELRPNHKIEPETPIWCNKNMTSCVSSPWGRWCALLGRGWSELSVLTWIPAITGGRERRDSPHPGLHLSINHAEGIT